MTYAAAPTLAALQPINIEAEQAFLGALLTQPEVYHKAQDVLCAEDFYEPLHQRIYTAAATLIESGQSATPVTLKAHFDNDNAIKQVGGPVYLARLASAAINCSNAIDFAHTIHELAARREIMLAARECFENAAYAKIDVTSEALINQYEADLAAIRDEYRIAERETDAASWADRSLEAVAAIQEGRDSARLMSGLADLDKLTGGFRAPQFVVAGRPGMGKTAFAWQLMLGAMKSGAGVAFSSLEMGDDEIGMRVLSNLSHRFGEPIAYEEMMRGERLTEAQLHILQRARDTMAKMPLHIDDRAARTVQQIRTFAHDAQVKLRREGTELGLVIIDYLQLVRSDDRHENDTSKMTAISGACKALAKDLGVCVVALSQLSRDVEKRDNKRPVMSDLRQSGAIEQDADKILFLYREHAYEQKKDTAHMTAEQRIAWQADLAAIEHEAEIIVDKNRQGRTGVANVYADMACNVFRNAVKNFSGGY